MSRALAISGQPTRAQAAAIAAAVVAVLEAERAGAAGDPSPAAYRSEWRRAGLGEAVSVPTHPGVWSER